jgi:hypothetical protein
MDGLTLELERLALSAISEEYDQANYTLFADKLFKPALQLSDGASQWGSWHGDPPTITLSRKLVVGHGWPTLVEVLKHEMAHQFVEQVLGVTEPSAHGPLFRRVCRDRGIDPAATGLRKAESAADPSVFGKVRRLLSLAQSGQRHEAEAAAAAAQRLMLKYNVELSQALDARDYCSAHLGKPSGRVQEAQRSLARVLREFFFVETLWVSAYRPLEGKRGSVLEVCGTRANVEMAQYVHDFLQRSAENLWLQHKRDNAIRANKDRRYFIAGVIAGFYAKLKAERARAAEEGLVWMGDPQLSQYFRRRFPKVTTVRYGTSSGMSAHSAGRQAGQRLVLHRGIGSGPSGRVRLLRKGR